MNKNLLFRSIPKVDILLEGQEIQDLIDVYGREFVMEAFEKKRLDTKVSLIGTVTEKSDKLIRLH